MRSTKSPSWISRLLGTDPRPVPPDVFLLDERKLSFGRFVRAESGFEIEDFLVAELPEELFGEGALGAPMHDPGLFRPVLRELLGHLDTAPTEASLVLPDAWLRLSFAELADLPPRGVKRQEALQWKLKRQVPFPVEDLRLQAVEVAALPDQEEPVRALVGYGIEALFSQLEGVFAECDVQLGQLLNRSLATATAVREVVGGLELAVVVLVSEHGYSLTFTRRGEPMLHRFRALTRGLSGDDAAELVRRDLRLTRAFVEEQLPGSEPGRVLLASTEANRRFWLDSLEAGLRATPVALEREQLPLRGNLPDAAMAQLAPMVGAAWQEFA